MKNIQKSIIFIGGSLLTTMAMANESSVFNSLNFGNESVQQSSKLRGLGIGAVALSNDQEDGSALLSATNGVGDTYQAGGEYQFCNWESKTKNVDGKLETSCSNFQAHGLIPIKKLSGAEHTSGVGVVVESNTQNIKPYGEDNTKTEVEALNFTAFGTVGVKNFDFGVKLKLRDNEVSNEGLEEYEDTYGEYSLSAAMQIDKNLRVAAIITPDNIHSHEYKTKDGAESVALAGNPFSYVIASSYKLEDQKLTLTGGFGKETATTYEFKNIADQDIKAEYLGHTTASVGAAMDLGMFKPRAGLTYHSSRHEQGQALSLGTDVILEKIALTTDLSYGALKFKEEITDDQTSEIDSNMLAMSVGMKAQF